MLDIQFIRDNPELVTEKSKQKGYAVDIPKLLEVDSKRREAIKVADEHRQKINELTKSFQGSAPSEEQRASVREVKEQLNRAEAEQERYDAEYWPLIKAVPNMPADDVPVGDSEEQNKVVKQWGQKPQFDFEPKSHWQIAEQRELIDKDRAAKVAGARFAYIKGGLVRLQFAVMQYVIDTLGNEDILKKIIADNNLQVSSKPFIPVLPPAMIKTDVYEAMDRLEPKEERYKIEGDELWVQGSAEHTLGSMYMDEILDEDQLPIRYVGFLTSFRREAGTYGKDTEGIIRMHQFDKLEMESFTTPGQGMQEHLLMVAIQEYLTQSLGLPYELLNKCTADIGKPNARGSDLNMWMPGQDKYRETHTADYMTDYQARRLMTRVRLHDGGQLQFVHTNDATAFALGRLLVAIMENNQTKEGKIRVPDVLRGYMGGTETI